MEKTRHGNIKWGKDGNQVKKNQPRNKGIVIAELLKKYGLSHHSAPEYFVSPFLPLKSNGYPTHRKEHISFDLLARWTNLKATLDGYGKGGSFITIGNLSAVGSCRKKLVFTYLLGWLLH